MRGLPCCCQDGGNPPSNQLRITEVLDECQTVLDTVYYTQVNSTTAPTCNQLAPVATSGCGCSCNYVVNAKPSFLCGGTTYEYANTPTDASASRESTLSRVVLLDYLDQANVSGTANWRFNDGSSVIVTNFVFGFTQVRLRYYNPSVPRLSPSATAGVFQYSCQQATSSSTGPLYGWFWERARYTNDISAFGVYGASATYAAWTIEITTTEAIIRDGSGTIQYQWALASYDMDGLRLAIDGTAELVGRRIALASGTNLRSAAATAIPPQGPKAVGQNTTTEAKIVLRTAGDEIEGYQIAGKAAYYVDTAATIPAINPWDRRTEDWFSGTLAQFRQGFRVRQEERLGASPPVYPPPILPHIAAPVGGCPVDGLGNPDPPGQWTHLGYGLTPNIGSDSLFGSLTDPVTGTVWEATFELSSSTTSGTSAGNGTTCIRYACLTTSSYKWSKIRFMLEVERI